MNWTLVVHDDLRNLLRHLPPLLKRKVKQALEEILADPFSGKTLREDLAGLSSYRIGKIRVVYRVEGKSIHFITVGPRKTVYQKTALELKKQAGFAALETKRK